MTADAPLVKPPAADLTAGGIVDRGPGWVLVFGSLPPHGRDLDVVVRPTERSRIEPELAANGFTAYGRTWVRFADCRVEVVDVVPIERWGLSPPEQRALFAESRPLPGRENLRRPSPHHLLLIMARRFAGDGRLNGPRRARVAEALEEDEAAWRTARERAPSWGATKALELLASVHRTGSRGPMVRRAAAVAQRGQAAGDRPVRAWLRAIRATGPRRDKGGVIAICGLDGAGKSSQASALAEALDRLGYEPLTRWTRISQNPSLQRLAGPVVAVLGAARRGRTPSGRLDVDPSRLRTPSQQLRQGSPLLTAGWASVVAVTNGLAQRRATIAQVRRSRLVICDRWTLDSAVALRYRYGESRRFRLQVRLIRAISPRPLVTFFLDIPAETAYARKDDHYDVDQLRRHARLYQEEYRRHRAVRLDGELPQTQLCAQIARTVLSELRRR